VFERRAKPRVAEPFTTTVSGIDKTGELFELDCIIDNISSTGVYIKMSRQLEQGSHVRLMVNFSADPSTAGGAAIRGVALRCDAQVEQTWGLAVAITEYAFIYSDSSDKRELPETNSSPFNDSKSCLTSFD